MITLIIRAGTSAPLLVETLSPLVEGVVQGLVGRLILVSTGDLPEIEAIAQEAGAELVISATWAEGLQLATAQVRTLWVLLVDAGVVAEPSLWTSCERHVRLDGKIAASCLETGFVESFLKLLSRMLGKINHSQLVLIKTKDIRGGVWGQSFGSRLTILPTRSRRIRF